MRSTITSLRRLLAARENGGVAALEFALLTPVFLIVFAGTVDLGDALYTRTLLESAVAAGTNFALVQNSQVNSTNGATLADNIATLVANSNTTAANVTVVVNNGPSETITNGTKATSGTASNANLYYCPTGSASNLTWGSSVSAGSSCTGGGTGGQFVTVSASYSFTAFFSSYGFVPNGTITVSSMVQTQ
jgi:Flp pilus assembly protein TadG